MNTKIFNKALYEEVCTSIEDMSNGIIHCQKCLLSSGIPFNKSFVLEYKDKYKEFIDEQCNNFTTGSIVPKATKDRIKSEYEEVYRSTVQAFTRLANIFSDPNIVLTKPDKEGISFVDIEKSKEVAKDTCYIYIDTVKAKRLTEAISNIVKAKDTLQAVCDEISVPSPFSGRLLYQNPYGYAGLVTNAAFYNWIDGGCFDKDGLWDKTVDMFKLYITTDKEN